MSQLNPIRILSVDDHHLVLQGIASVINEEPDMLVVSQASDGPEAIRKFREYRPDVTLMDLRMPGQSGLDAMIAIRAEFPAARVIILTTFDGDVEVQRALQAGASGYFLKSSPPNQLVEAIRQVHAGRKQVQVEVAAQIAEHFGEEALTAREVEVLEHVIVGRRNREIGQRLFISGETVKVHLKHIMDKLGARDRAHAVSIANRRGIIRFDSEIHDNANSAQFKRAAGS